LKRYIIQAGNTLPISKLHIYITKKYFAGLPEIFCIFMRQDSIETATAEIKQAGTMKKPE